MAKPDAIFIYKAVEDKTLVIAGIEGNLNFFKHFPWTQRVFLVLGI